VDAGRLSQAAKLCVLSVLPLLPAAARNFRRRRRRRRRLPACLLLLLLLLRARCARRYHELAELLEAEGMPVEAIENYEKASDLFLAENSTSSSHKALIRVAHLAATLEPPELERAADTFTKVGSECLTNNLLKFQAKGYFFNAFLCILARTDVFAADGALARFKKMDYTFPGSRECKLCDDVLQSFKDLNADSFTEIGGVSAASNKVSTRDATSRVRYYISILYHHFHHNGRHYNRQKHRPQLVAERSARHTSFCHCCYRTGRLFIVICGASAAPVDCSVLPAARVAVHRQSSARGWSGVCPGADALFTRRSRNVRRNYTRTSSDAPFYSGVLPATRVAGQRLSPARGRPGGCTGAGALFAGPD